MLGEQLIQSGIYQPWVQYVHKLTVHICINHIEEKTISLPSPNLSSKYLHSHSSLYIKGPLVLHLHQRPGIPQSTALLLILPSRVFYMVDKLGNEGKPSLPNFRNFLKIKQIQTFFVETQGVYHLCNYFLLHFSLLKFSRLLTIFPHLCQKKKKKA